MVFGFVRAAAAAVGLAAGAASAAVPVSCTTWDGRERLAREISESRAARSAGIEVIDLANPEEGVDECEFDATFSDGRRSHILLAFKTNSFGAWVMEWKALNQLPEQPKR